MCRSLPTEGAQSGDKLEILLGFYFTFYVTGIKPKATELHTSPASFLKGL